MSAIVDYLFYSTVYVGQEATEASFPALCARAADIVGAMAHWQVTPENIGTYPQHIQNAFRKAICAQVDYLATNGLDSITGGNERGWTVGKVSVSGKSGSELVRKGAMAEYIAPMAQLYLEQTGLLNPSVPVVDSREIGWWY